MKKLILLGFSIFVCTGIHAQLYYKAGIRAGANVSTQTTSEAATNVETNWKPGVHIGIFGSIFYTEKIACQLEFMYSQKGSVVSDPTYVGKELVSYIDVPLTFRFQAFDLLNIHAGPQFSFFTRAFRMSDEGAAYNISEYYDDLDVGLLVGVELNLPIKLNIAVRYIEGLMVSSDSRYYTDPWKNRVVQLSLSYAIWGE